MASIQYVKCVEVKSGNRRYDAVAKRYCPKCKRSMEEKTQWYKKRNGEYPELCKQCLTLHVENDKPDTYTWILQELDYPYVEREWIKIYNREYTKDPYKMTGMTVLGRYLSIMKLNQWKDYNGWADNEKIAEDLAKTAEKNGGSQKEKEKYEEKVEDMKKRFEQGEISEAQLQTFMAISAPEPPIEFISPEPPPKKGKGANNPYPENEHPFEEIETVDISALLTLEDKQYLAVKWGKLYTSEEWLFMEKLFVEMMDSFVIQGAARIDTLKTICKTSLKMNAAIDCGDVESFQKYSKVYDSLMKSAKFTEAQNKEAEERDFDSVGAITLLCEQKTGFIPIQKIDVNFDVFDEVISDMKRWNKEFIEEDPIVSKQIEAFIKKREIKEQMDADEAEAKAEGQDYVKLKDEDIANWTKTIEEQKNMDFKSVNAEGE